MIPLLLLLSIATPASANPGVGEERPPVEASRPTFKDQLEGAKKAYFQGHREDALRLLIDLQTRFLLDPEAVPWEVASEALIYLGEVNYFLEDLDRAGDAWRIVLERDPNHPALSPFAHPPEVAGEFERLRGLVRVEIAARPVPKPPPLPAWSVLPLGIPQMVDGHPARGVIYGSLQVGCAAGSLVMIRHLRSRNVSDPNHPLGWSEEQQVNRINLQRYAVQWPLTFGFYGAWVGSHVDARVQWRRNHAASATVGWAPTPSQPARVAVFGKF